MPNQIWPIDFYPPLVGLRLNIRLSPEGNWPTKGSDEFRDTDIKAMNQLRKISDVIVTGATTAKANNYRPSKWAPVAVISRTLDALDLPLFQTSTGVEFPPFLLTPDRDHLEKEFVKTFNTNSDLATAIRLKLGDLGFQKILLETGPSLSKEFEPYIDEICLTSSSGTEPLELLGKHFTRKLTLISETNIETDMFTRWALSD